MTNSYFVLTKEKPRLQKLRNLLEMNLYCGKAYDQNNDANKVKHRFFWLSALILFKELFFNLIKKYYMKDFLELIQSSEDEIYNYLNYIEAFQIDG